MKTYDKFFIATIAVIVLITGYAVVFLSEPHLTHNRVVAIADSVAHAKIDSLCPSLVRKMQDWDVLHSQVQFHATLFRRRYTGRSKWHKHVRQELDIAHEYWQPKNKGKK